VPSLNIYDSTNPVIITNYGYEQDTITINLNINNGLLRYYQGTGKVPHGGYITMGDHNAPAYDQPYSGGYEPVLPEWIIGKAWGELPWFGLIKLWVGGVNVDGVPSNSWTGLFGTVALLLLIPFLMDYIYPKAKKFIRKNKDDKVEEPKAELDEQTPEEIDPGKEVPKTELDEQSPEEIDPRKEEPKDETIVEEPGLHDNDPSPESMELEKD